jgi:hypothetical protein
MQINTDESLFINERINFIKFIDWNTNINTLNVPDFKINHWRGFSSSKALKNFIDFRFLYSRAQ